MRVYSMPLLNGGNPMQNENLIRATLKQKPSTISMPHGASRVMLH